MKNHYIPAHPKIAAIPFNLGGLTNGQWLIFILQMKIVFLRSLIYAPHNAHHESVFYDKIHADCNRAAHVAVPVVQVFHMPGGI